MIKKINYIDFETNSLTGEIVSYYPITIDNNSSLIFMTPLNLRRSIDSDIFDEILYIYFSKNVYVIMEYGYSWDDRDLDWELLRLDYDYSENDTWIWDYDWDEGQDIVKIHGILISPDEYYSDEVRKLYNILKGE